MLPKRYRGLAVPDIRKYHQAIHLSRMVDWNRHADYKLWVRIEQAQSDVPLGGASWLHASLSRKMKNQPLIGNTAKICSVLLSSPSISSSTSPLYPIMGNPLFPPGSGGPNFRNLRDLGLTQASRFVQEGAWPTIPRLVDRSGPFRLDFWGALQLSHFLRTLPAPGLFARPLTIFEESCSETGPMPHILSANYELLTTPAEPHVLNCIQNWERDLGKNYSTTYPKVYIQILYLRENTGDQLQDPNQVVQNPSEAEKILCRHL